VIIGLVVYYARNGSRFTAVERWSIAGIVGGGLGNLIDRVVRPEGVVDFLDVKFYGLFGLERWPTFNVADASVVVCGVLLVISVLASEVRREES
jgi:signal peptidase II